MRSGIRSARRPHRRRARLIAGRPMRRMKMIVARQRCRTISFREARPRGAGMRMAARCLGRISSQMHDNGSQESCVCRVDDVDRARAQEYALLATLLSRSPDDRMLGHLALLRGDASPLGAAHTALAEAAAKADAKSVKAEYFDLFDGLGGSGFLPYASYYLTGSLYGRPLARLRQALQRLGIDWAEHLSEPEDHAAIL